MELNQDAKDIKERISSNSKYLVINRIPIPAFNQFKELAEKEFCKDHGMCLKHLVDFYFGLIPSGIEHVEEEIEFLREEINELKLQQAKPESKEDKVKKMLDGRRMKK